jgi:hypothetical protein
VLERIGGLFVLMMTCAIAGAVEPITAIIVAKSSLNEAFVLFSRDTYMPETPNPVCR